MIANTHRNNPSRHEGHIMNLTFAHRKATQALNYFAIQSAGKINKLKALKLVYFADRYHLRTYGRPITNDRYLAMNYGPVASSCKDLAEMSDFLGGEESAYVRQFLSPSGHDFASTSKVETIEFSETDSEAVEYAWRQYGDVSEFDLAKKTHQFPEWKQHESKLQSPYESRVPMHYKDFLENPPLGVDSLEPLSPEAQEDLSDQIDELHTIESVWR
jgi:uncharacterized phage-associated protein